MAMLSVDPLDKYFANYIVGHTVQPADLVRSTLHPWNDTNQTRAFARQRIYWYGKAKTAALWRRAEIESDAAMREVEVRRTGQRLWKKLRDIGCLRTAGVLALALEATKLGRAWRMAPPLTVYAPSDEAFSRHATQIEPLLGVGAETALLRLIRAHVVSSLENDAQAAHHRVVSGPHSIEDVTLWVIDGLVSPDKMRMKSRAG